MTSDNSRQRPKLLYALTEGPRYLHERAQVRIARRWLQRATPGDGHGVMLLPGYLASDKYNRPLIDYLQSLGYVAVGWGQGVNTGPTPEKLKGLAQQFDELYARSGGKVSLIGHSLGGIYAREMARQFPERVRQVLSLGSPIGKYRDTGTSADNFAKVFNLDAGLAAGRQRIAEAPPVPTSALFTRSDGVVPWSQSVQKNGHQQSENIEVQGSHCGLTVNALVWYLLAERLAQPEDQWQPFVPTGWQRLVYPQCAARNMPLHAVTAVA